MKKSLLFALAVLTWTTMYSQGQNTVLQEWSTTAGTQHFFYRNVTKTVGSYVYVAGATQNAHGDYDILLAKYNNSGVQQWIRQVDGAAHYQDFATALQVDGSGNVYITGAITNDSISLLSDLFIKKYNSSGTIQWTNTYDGYSLYDCGTDIYVSSGGVAVTGGSYNASANLDFVTILYNSSGTQLWATRYAHSSGMDDVPVSVLKKGANVVVAGAVQTGTGAYSWAVVSYTASTGVQNNLTISSGGTTGIEEAHAMVQDANGNIYIAGITPTISNGYDYDIIKLDSNLVIQWEQTYDGADHLDDIANGIQVSASGSVYVTGYSKTTTGLNDYLTLKYDGSGSLVWSRSFNDSFNGNDEASAIVLDNSGKPCITGSVQTDINQLDYYTMKYDTAGTAQWGIYFDGNKHLDDKATNIAIDTVGAVVVTGESETAAGVYEYATVKYVEKNIITPTDFSGEEANNGFLYYENKGQLTTTDDTTLVPRVRYYTNYFSPTLYIMDDTLSMVFVKADTSVATTDTIQKINLSFTGCNEHLKVYPLEEQKMYLNYFLGHCPTGITEIYGNQRLVVPELYDNIDLIYYSNPAGFKYYFVVKPGGDPEQIRMQYMGATSTNISSNVLTVNSLIGSVSYVRPFMYSLDNMNDTVAGSGVDIDWHHISGDLYDFHAHAYDSTKALVLEVKEGALSCTPQTSYKNIRLSTYYGGTNDDQIEGMAVDTAGNAYYTGSAYGIHTYPTTTGALSPSGGAVYEGVLSKFNAFGAQKYATYFGGTGGTTWFYGVTTRRSGEPTIAGFTKSTNFPSVHSGSQYTQSLSGGEDACIARLNTDGTIVQWSTVFGGSGIGEQFNRVSNYGYGTETYAVGKGNELTPHVTELTAYNSPMPTSSGQKGVIAHFDSNDSLIWSTFIGSEIKALDGLSGAAIGGVITSSTLPFTHAPGTYVDSAYAGGTDAFFAIISSADYIYWATYYGGSGFDACNAVKWQAIEGFSYLYAAGTTKSDSTMGFSTFNPGNGAYFNGTFHGGDDAYFCKFDAPSMHRQWATYYGTGSEASHSEVATGIATDNFGNVYFSGSTNSQLENNSFLSGTSAWYAQNYTNTSSDYQAFVLGLTQNLAPFWATNFGGQIYENCTDMAVDYKNNYLYITGISMTNSNAIGFPAYRPSSFAGGWYRCESASPAISEGYFSQFNISDGVLAGINENNKPAATSLITFPNPFSNEITFNFDAGNSKDYLIQVYNTLGQLVFLSKEKAMSEMVSQTIELPVNKGLYYVQIKLTNRTLAGKIIKQ